ncbi:MAG: Crp/Fnr family transcriptional regulator [Clostridia bacterium]|nr:Crp/Fnr family transcriptional regulator [Clostridia bacterium]
MKARKELFEKAVKLLKAHPAFSGAKEEALRYVLTSEDSLLKDFSKGQQVFPCHGVKKAVGIILTGGCHLLEGGKITANQEDGFIFGVSSLYAPDTDSFTLSASQDSKVVFIKKTAVDWLLQDDFSAARSFLEFLSDEINSDKNKEKQNSNAEGELAQYLLTRPKNAKNEVSLPQDMLKVAKSLNLSKDGLYKAIEKLNASGAIGFSGTAIIIKSEALLREFI